MISERQLAANRANAQKSTGPKTEESKKIVSQNALRHGLTAQVTIMPDEDREAHDKFCAAIVESRHTLVDGAVRIARRFRSAYERALPHQRMADNAPDCARRRRAPGSEREFVFHAGRYVPVDRRLHRRRSGWGSRCAGWRQ